ncbi:unnamed protein product [Arctia plantaginis]|uniref:Uncharacterized protein n=1 Tax=Arctia plantaginis TaxID=874455 RepID=A0A8S1BKE0_ARCPL|nr:unnamed protein product [Arctia plantaginis]
MDTFIKIFPREVTKGGKEYTLLKSEPESPEYKWKSRVNENSTLDVTCCKRICKKSIAVQTILNHGVRNFKRVNINIADSKQNEFLQTQGPNVSNIYAHNSNKCIAVQHHIELRLTDDIPKTTPLTVMYNKCVCTERRMFEKCVGPRTATWKRGPYSKNSFSLGTAEHRRLQRNSCSTRMIGGYRVPVYVDVAGGGTGVEDTEGDGSVGNGVGGGVEYTLRSGGSVGRGEDSPNPPRPVIEDPPDSICPWTLRIPNIDVVPVE